MRNTDCLRLLRRLSLTAAALSSACAGFGPPTTPRVDASFGESVRASRALQAANPQAAANTDPVAGIDGEAARSAIVRYEASFRQPPPTFNVLGIGGLGTTSVGP